MQFICKYVCKVTHACVKMQILTCACKVDGSICVSKMCTSVRFCMAMCEDVLLKIHMASERIHQRACVFGCMCVYMCVHVHNLGRDYVSQTKRVHFDKRETTWNYAQMAVFLWE